MSKQLFYIGGYSGNSPYSLYLCQYDGNQIQISENYEIENASYLCFSPDRQHLYAVIETAAYKGRDGGGVAAFSVQGDNRLRYINDGFTGGAAPCFLSVSSDGQTLYAANYTGGSSAIFNIRPDGGAGVLKKLIPHTDFGHASRANPERQENAHAHYIGPLCIEGMQTLWICDLGLDCVIVLSEGGAELARFQTPPGYGPRHLAFHPRLPYAYAVCEMGSAVFALKYGFQKDTFSLLETSTAFTLPEPDPDSTCAAVRVSPGGRHLLVSNRGMRTDSISVLDLNADGNIARLNYLINSGGKCPRDIQFNPAGGKLFAANQESDLVSVFDWDEGKGALSLTDMRLTVEKPSCILFK